MLNPTINSIFNKTESQDLQRILDFFENSICINENIKKENINECYKKFFERIKGESEKDGNIYLKISFNEQQRVYEQINNSTFGEIWKFEKNLPQNSSADTLKYITYKYESKYINYLKELGKTYKVIESYKESFLNAGDMSPIMFANVIMGYENYNTEDIRIKLFIAIHYLTLNDQNERKEEH